MSYSASWRFGVGLAWCVLVAGCGLGAAGGDDAGEAAGAATTSGGSGAGGPGALQADVIRDDFSDPESGWLRRTRDEYGADYEDGAYVVWVDNAASNYIASTGSHEAAAELGDTRFEISATKVSGPEGSPIGLSCRQWSDSDRRGIYFADLDAEGEVRVGLYDEEGQQILAEAQRPGLWRDGANALRLDCIGDQISFFVNGEEVLSASNDRFAQGRVGVRAGGGSSGVTRVAFDDAVITVVGS
jgi:hypothetical protein